MALLNKDAAFSAITAGTTQTLAGATPILSDITDVTVGVANDGVVLPQVAPGVLILVRNVTANAGKMYAPNGGTIDGTAGATGVALTASKATFLYCTGLVAAGGPVYKSLTAL